MEISELEKRLTENAKAGSSCGKCSHVKVCAVFRAIAPLMNNWDEETKPLEPKELAKICSLYQINFGGR